MTKDLNSVDRASLFAACKDIATAPNVLSLFEEDLHGCAFAGDTRIAQLIFTTFYTRFFQRPACVSVRGASSSGKSYTMNTAVRFIPAEAYEMLTGMSEKMLVHWNADLRNKILCVQELAGIPGTKGSLYLRSLISEGRLRYAVTEHDGDKFVVREKKKEGPTGLLLTTTSSSLYHEDDTRILSVPVKDTPEQTRNVLLEQAAQFATNHKSEPNFEKWHAFHTWVAAGPHIVRIPFAEVLARNVDSSANRIKRDFGQVLSLTAAVALMHQLNREIEKTGEVVASLDDYAIVYELVGDILSEGVQASISPELRATVMAVGDLTLDPTSVDYCEGCPNFAVAKKLGLHEGTASKRLHDAEAQGYLVNNEYLKGRPTKWVTGKPLPENRGVLPTPSELSGKVDEAIKMAA